jgi:hypothetical protein
MKNKKPLPPLDGTAATKKRYEILIEFLDHAFDY